jgi:hypothetical protein
MDELDPDGIVWARIRSAGLFRPCSARPIRRAPCDRLGLLGGICRRRSAEAAPFLGLQFSLSESEGETSMETFILA